MMMQASHDFSRIKLSGFFVELDYQIRIYDRDLSTGSVTSVTSDYKRAQHWINDSEYDRFLHIYNIYNIYVCICVYIYIMLCKITGAQALFQYLIWSYHITSRRHEHCILFDRSNFDMRLSSNAARQHWALLTAWDACQIFKWNNLASSRLQVMGSGIRSSWQGNLSGCVRCLCCYASAGVRLKWR